MKKIAFLISITLIFLSAKSQDELIKKIIANQTDSSGFKFTNVKLLENSSVKNQGRAGTCWSFSSNSLLESEMIRMGKTPIDLSEIYTARNVYFEKGKQYLLWDGLIGITDGAELHDCFEMLKKYGTMPQQIYKGNYYGVNPKINEKLQPILKQCIDSFKNNYAGKPKISEWQKEYKKILDTVLGPVPDSFFYNGSYYTPLTFLNKVVGINPDDYVEFSSYKDYPYYKKFVFPVPDNWNHYCNTLNVPMEDMITIIDFALSKGITVGWACDVSEPYFSWKNGVAYVPDVDLYNIQKSETGKMFEAPMPEKQITEDMRQEALNNLSTTDDHGMHLVGSAKDQLGNEYYIVKNSWGINNDYEGYIYVSKNYVRYKTTAMMLHKDGIPENILSKCQL